MAIRPESVAIIAIAAAIVTAAFQYHVHSRAGTQIFIYGFLCSVAIAMSALALLAGTVGPQAQAVADIGIMVAGCAAFASSAWLRYTFKLAGDVDDG